MATENEAAVVGTAEPETKKRVRKTKSAESAPAEAAAGKKAPAKKAEPKTNVVIEYAGKQIAAADAVKAAIKAYKKANKGVVVKKVDVYIKPEENAAYYVVNGEASADYKIEL